MPPKPSSTGGRGGWSKSEDVEMSLTPSPELAQPRRVNPSRKAKTIGRTASTTATLKRSRKTEYSAPQPYPGGSRRRRIATTPVGKADDKHNAIAKRLLNHCSDEGDDEDSFSTAIQMQKQHVPQPPDTYPNPYPCQQTSLPRRSSIHLLPNHTDTATSHPVTQQTDLSHQARSDYLQATACPVLQQASLARQAHYHETATRPVFEHNDLASPNPATDQIELPAPLFSPATGYLCTASHPRYQRLPAGFGFLEISRGARPYSGNGILDKLVDLDVKGCQRRHFEKYWREDWATERDWPVEHAFGAEEREVGNGIFGGES